MDKVLANLSAFFDFAAPSSSMPEVGKQRLLTKTRFDALSEEIKSRLSHSLTHDFGILL